MAAADRLLFGAIGALALFVGRLALRPAHPSVGASRATDAAADARREAGDSTAARAVTPLPPPGALFGTYLPDMLAARDSVLHRWPARALDAPLRVWVQPASAVPDWSPRLVQPARDAVLTWDQAALPVRLALAADSATADVRVTWESALEGARIGVARVEMDADGWITGGTLRLAVHATSGAPLPESTVRAAALHEVGHLLGLDHTADTTAIMAAHATGRDRLAPADLATMRLLYSLPAGRVGGGG